jgi:hypothetical protein
MALYAIKYWVVTEDKTTGIDRWGGGCANTKKGHQL